MGHWSRSRLWVRLLNGHWPLWMGTWGVGDWMRLWCRMRGWQHCNGFRRMGLGVDRFGVLMWVNWCRRGGLGSWVDRLRGGPWVNWRWSWPVVRRIDRFRSSGPVVGFGVLDFEKVLVLNNGLLVWWVGRSGMWVGGSGTGFMMMVGIQLDWEVVLLGRWRFVGALAVALVSVVVAVVTVVQMAVVVLVSISSGWQSSVVGVDIFRLVAGLVAAPTAVAAVTVASSGLGTGIRI